MKQIFRLQGSIRLDGEPGPGEDCDRKFTVVTEGGHLVNVTVNLREGRITAITEASLTEDALNSLRDGPDENGVISNAAMWAELDVIRHDLMISVERVVTGLKYYLNRCRVSDRVIGTEFFWQSNTENDVKIRFPLRFITSAFQDVWLDDTGTKRLQAYLDSNIEVLTSGLRHLHRARNEENPVFQWIDATIAAELAIKQCLIHLKPDLETLLLEVPSPPLTKLYGVVLQSVTGQRSSKLSALGKGIETRNKLIHRPTAQTIDEEEAMTYLDDVEIAIFELMTLMYPDDPVIERICKKRVVFQQIPDNAE